MDGEVRTVPMPGPGQLRFPLARCDVQRDLRADLAIGSFQCDVDFAGPIQSRGIILDAAEVQPEVGARRGRG